MFFDFPTIAQALNQVKFKSQFVMPLLCAFLSLGCQSGRNYQLKTQKLYTDRLETHPNYLVMPLQYEPAAELRKELESRQGLHLKNRGEAHITVISPPEFEVLKNALSMEDINQIAKNQGLQRATFEVVCLGSGQVSPELVTYFLVVKSEALLKIRSEIEKAWNAKSGKGNFQAAHFYPHITLGFSQRDLHETDGVIKDERSCLHDVSTR